MATHSARVPGTEAAPFALSLFETPVIVDEVPDAVALNAALASAIRARRAASPGVRISNIDGWQSDNAMLHWGGEPARRLEARILAAADRFTVDIAARDGTPRHKWVANMWANISPPGGSNQMHTHPGAYWSAVYYVDDGYAGAFDPVLGGELVLLDPRMPTVLMAMPNLRFRAPDGAPHEPQLNMRPKSGRIIMFPGWLTHGVMPYRGRGERISIAVNLVATPRG